VFLLQLHVSVQVSTITRLKDAIIERNVKLQHTKHLIIEANEMHYISQIYFDKEVYMLVA